MADDVIESIRFKVALGALPRPCETKDKVWAGKGNGRPCDACDQPITADDAEYEVDVPPARTVRLHQQCFSAWRSEGASASQ
jgi:hypothetical protein